MGSEHEQGLAKQASVDKYRAAVYDVREKLGGFLFAASSLEEFRDRVAMTKNDQSLFKVIEAAGLFPGTGVVRRIAGKKGALEEEFLSRLGSPGLPPTPDLNGQVPGGAGPGADLGTSLPESGDVGQWPGATSGVGASPVTAARTACWPGCHDNEAHSAKFHSTDKDKKEA